MIRMRNVTREILSRITEGKTFDLLSRELGMRKSTVEAIVDSMVHTGHLEEILCGIGCRICPMKCSSPQSTSRMKMYAITRKGIERIKRAEAEV